MSVLGKRKTFSIQTKMPRFSKNNPSVSIVQSKRRKFEDPVILKPKRGAQVKYSDTTISNQQPATVGIVTPLNLMATGNTDVTRVGNKITCRSVSYRLDYSQATTAASPDSIRATLIYDNAVDGVLPAATDIFTVDSIDGLMNMNNTGRFKVLSDEIINFPTLGSSRVAEKKHIKLHNAATNFITTGGTIAGCGQGAIYLYLNSKLNVAANSNIFGYVRVKYTDQ